MSVFVFFLRFGHSVLGNLVRGHSAWRHYNQGHYIVYPGFISQGGPGDRKRAQWKIL